ncbi:hypothetical protein L873DRAFT_1695836 [Choiromyces venosus 120613-1]|uniref:Uncharacterized protein n=1 Tax=Choiromyces venosus 120613-1 TaxID=1336337 RepID=A0A3N4JFK9_9PEZI|nr:hypothetical protein L873DRAFT_1695836 [Choiromyces venosus 120613-1]
MYFEYGKNNNRYWMGEHMVEHIINVVILMFELCYPDGNIQGLFFFDNEVSHSCYAEDAL